MKEELNLIIPKTNNKIVKKQSKIFNFIIIMFLLAIIIMIGLIYKKIDNIKTPRSGTMLPIGNIKELALKLETQGFNEISALTWKKYLNTAGLTNIDAANIWYRIGKLYEKDNQYDKAIESYYKSESFTKIPEIETEISSSIQQCLESLGKFSALKYELDSRVGIDLSKDNDSKVLAGNEIVAEIGYEKITKSDLDKRIESMIEQQLSPFADNLPLEERNKQKEIMLKQFSSNTKKLNFLNQIVFEDILYRKAREDKLVNDKNIQNILKSQEKSFLAQKIIEQEINNKINITESDMKNYYESHKNNYIKPEKAKISHILVANEKDALKVHQRLKNNELFKDIAKDMSIDSKTSNNSGEIKEWIDNDKISYIAGFGDSVEAKKIIFETKVKEVAKRDIKTDKGIHIVKVDKLEKQKEKSFAQVKQDLYQTLRTEKEREIQTKFLSSLKNKYNVVIHQSFFMDNNNPQVKEQKKK